MTVSAQVLHAFRWNAAGRISAQLGNWLITIFVMRLLRPSDYGLMGLVAILMALFGLVNDLGAIPSLIQRPEIDRELVRKVFGLVLLTNGFLYAVAFLGAPTYAAFFGEPQLVAVTRVFATTMLLEALAAVPGVLLRRELNFKAISLIDFVATIIGSLLVLVLALRGLGVWALVFGTLMKSLCNTLGLLAVTRFRLPPLFRFSGLHGVFSFGIKISSASIVWYFTQNVDSALIGKFLGDHALGLYSVAANLATLPVTKAMQMIQQLAFATYARVQDDRETVIKYLLESLRLASFIFFPTCWGMSAVAADFTTVVLGAKWQAATPVLQIVAIGVPFRAFTMLLYPLVTGTGRPEVTLKNTVTTACIVPAAVLVGIRWGLTGVCVAALIGILVSTLINFDRTIRVAGAGYAPIVSVCLPSVVAAAVMYAAVVGARSALFADLPAVTRLAATVGVGALTYAVMTMTFNRPAPARLLQIIRGAA
jgi:teichuronic acid exporter